MSELLLEIFGGWVRAALVGLSLYLINHHIVTAEQGDKLTSELFSHVMLGVPVVASLAWTTWAKYRTRSKFLMALMMVPGTTENQVKEAIKEGMPTPSVTTPPNTIPGVPK